LKDGSPGTRSAAGKAGDGSVNACGRAAGCLEQVGGHLARFPMASLYRRGDKWAVRYYDDQGKRRRKSFGGGREGKQEASDWLSRKLEEVEGLRRGDVDLEDESLATAGLSFSRGARI
jgi:hypothetical protein